MKKGSAGNRTNWEITAPYLCLDKVDEGGESVQKQGEQDDGDQEDGPPVELAHDDSAYPNGNHSNLNEKYLS